MKKGVHDFAKRNHTLTKLLRILFLINILEEKKHKTVIHQVGPGSGLWSESDTDPFFPNEAGSGSGQPEPGSAPLIATATVQK